MAGLKFFFLRVFSVCLFAGFGLVACNPVVFENVRKKDLKKDVVFETRLGEIVFRLSDETPLHRNNFIQLVNQHFYDSLLFHRVINQFIIQTGDPDSKLAKPGIPLGEADLPYTIPAEFNPNLFHKRGALNAARDDNPERASSSTQFTFVQGRVYTDSTLNIAEKRINGWLAFNKVFHQFENKEIAVLYEGLRKRQTNPDSLALISNKIRALADVELKKGMLYKIPEEHRLLYKTLGGAAHLDQNYTVFGEVVKGMDVVDKIAAVKTDSLDRPLENVRIISAKLVKRKNY
ncbi:MAG TPA: peptidylprolyl isomerase [Prolixibacteraceae bacterium]|nr:peptidylprolyl isomerase [Prolixibacteraceae bacterium]